MSNKRVEQVIINASDVIDTYRACNVLEITQFFRDKEHTDQALVYRLLVEYEDTGETVELIAALDSDGELFAFENIDDYTLIS